MKLKFQRNKLQKYVRLSARDGVMLLLGVLICLAAMGADRFVQRPVPLAAVHNGITISWTPDTVKRWSPQIDTMAKRYNIDPNYIAIIMTMESGGYAKADSGYAQGLMQITPATAKEIAAKHLKKPVDSYDIWDPATNIEFGTAYLAWLRDQFGVANQGPSWNATAELVAAGYNGGPGAANDLEQGTGLTSLQTLSYSRDVFNMWRERTAADSPTFDRWKDRGGKTLLDKAAANR
jgi:soluble lytic murein transglycosylase